MTLNLANSRESFLLLKSSRPYLDKKLNKILINCLILPLLASGGITFVYTSKHTHTRLESVISSFLKFCWGEFTKAPNLTFQFWKIYIKIRVFFKLVFFPIFDQLSQLLVCLLTRIYVKVSILLTK